MRKLVVLRKMSKAIVVLTVAISFSTVLAERELSLQEIDNDVMGQFITLHVIDEPVSGLSGFLQSLEKPAKKITAPKHVAVATCDKYDALLRKHAGKAFVLRKAQMQAESSCDAMAQGDKGDTGLFQVRKPACDEVGVKGNLFEPETNIKCAVRYLSRLCSHYGWCTDDARLVAYNVGPTGARLVRNYAAHPYSKRVKSFLASM